MRIFICLFLISLFGTYPAFATTKYHCKIKAITGLRNLSVMDTEDISDSIYDPSLKPMDFYAEVAKDTVKIRSSGAGRFGDLMVGDRVEQITKFISNKEWQSKYSEENADLHFSNFYETSWVSTIQHAGNSISWVSECINSE